LPGEITDYDPVTLRRWITRHQAGPTGFGRENGALAHIP
jgi:hypothetical protein